MRKVLITPATFKPFSFEAIRDYPELKVGDGDEANVIRVIQSAVATYERYTQNILCESVWDLYLDEFPTVIETPAPLVSVTSITYVDSAGASQTLSSSVYQVSTAEILAGRIALKYGQTWPTTIDQLNTVIIRLTAGYASAAAIPQDIKDGLLLKMQSVFYGIDLTAAYQSCWRPYRRDPV